VSTAATETSLKETTTVSGIAFSPSQFEAAVEKILESGEKVAELVRRVPELLDRLSNPLLILVRGYLEKIVELFQKALDKIMSFLEDLGKGIMMPYTFWQVGQRWKNEVATPMSLVTAAVSPDSRPISRGAHWSGDAADSYATKTGSQSSAAQAVTDKGNEMGTAAYVLAGVGLTTYLAIVTGFVMFVVEQATATVGDAAVVTIPVSVPAHAISGAKMVGIIVGVVTAIAATVVAVGSSMSTIADQGQASGVFGGNTWPSGTA
jgi:hypothetical protein